MPKVGLLVDSARARGLDVSADMYVYTAGGTGLASVIPAWAHEGGIDSLKARLRQPAIRARLKREIVTGSPGWWDIVDAAGGWDGIVVANTRNPANARFEGKSVSAIAKAWPMTDASPPRLRNMATWAMSVAINPNPGPNFANV